MSDNTALSVLGNSEIDAVEHNPGQLMDTAIESILGDPLALPTYVQDLIVASKAQNSEGEIAWALVGLWALGKVEYVAPDFWDDLPGGWKPVESS